MATSPKSRKTVSTRTYLDSAGKESSYPVNGGSVTYTLLGDDGKTAVKTWPYSGGAFAQFGFVTKVGNVINTVLNADEPGTREEAAAEAQVFLAGVEQVIWREPTAGIARGPKYDRDVLAESLVAELAASAKGDSAHYRTRLDDKAYYAKVRNNPAVMARYMTAMAAKGATSESDLA
jgi:hypothetical protein